MKILAISIYLFFVALFFIITYYAIHRENKAWNNGICPICGHELDCCFGCDYAQSGDGWECDNCGYTACVTYRKLVYRKWIM